jgi:hypothetical protein
MAEGAPPAEGALDLQSLTEQQVGELLGQGITLDQIAQIAAEQGQPVPPIVQAMMQQQMQGLPEQQQQMMMQANQGQGQLMGPPQPPMPSKSNKFPTMMSVNEYKNYQNVLKEEKKATQEHKPNVYGYTFSPLISEQLIKDMKRTQGSFFVGVNISNLLNTFRDMIVDTEKKGYKPKTTSKMLKSNPDSIFNKIGEWVDVDFENILDKKMGFRGSDIPLLPEKQLTDYSTFYEILAESKKYSDRGFNGKITPYGLLIMTRMLYKYRNSNSQWFRVATVLELIFKYLGGSISREAYFKNNDEISLMSLMDLEEFYNTDHIFMTEPELIKFKSDLDFYKYDKNINVKKEIEKIQKKVLPHI